MTGGAADDALSVAIGDDELVAAVNGAVRLRGAIGGRIFEDTVHTFALVELLLAKGVIDEDELSASLDGAAAVVSRQVAADGISIRVSEDGGDKYAMPEAELAGAVDCENRVHLCQGACCRMHFSLSSQDVDEGVVAWELSEPFANRKAEGGWCVHHDAAAHGCGVYQQRPATCRVYSCQDDPRIWTDFAAYEINPDLLHATDAYHGPVSLPPPRRRTVSD